MSIQWYPGHIAKAERDLKEQLKLVDVVLEIRDARIPLVTYHPKIAEWVGSKTKVLVLNRVDMIPDQVRQLWQKWFASQGEVVYFTNSQSGQGVKAIAQAAQNAGQQVNQKRRDRGMLPRPVRAVVIGFPNVGKSALINRLLKKRVVASARKAGVTRTLRWVRLSEAIELLDAPGVIPAKIDDPEAALKLAICEDIGEAAYDNQQVAQSLVDFLTYFEATTGGLITANCLLSRYQLPATDLTGEQYLIKVAEHRYQGDIERTARHILDDFRKGLLGTIPLELPPNYSDS